MTEEVVKQTTTQAQETLPKRRLLKWLAISVGSLITVVIILLLVIYFTLRSGSLTQSAVPEIKPYLKPFGIELNKIGSLRFDLLKSIELEDLELNWQDPELGDAAVSIGNFNFEYSLSDLFSQRAEISQMILNDVQITAHIRQSESSPPTAVVKGEETSLDLSEISDLLKNPPILMSVQNVSISNIHLDVSLEQSDALIEYRGDLDETNMTLLWEPQQLSGLFNMVIGENVEKNLLKVTSRLDDKKIQLNASPGLNVSLNWLLENNNDQWRLSDTKIGLKLNTENIKLVEGEQGSQKELISLDKIDFQSNNVFSSTHEPPSAQGLENIFPLNVNSQISSDLLNLRITDVTQDDLSITAQANHQLKVKLDGKINPFNQQVPALKFNIDEELRLDNLDLLVADQKINASEIDWILKSEGETLYDGQDNPNLDIVLNANLKSNPITLDKPEGEEGDPGLAVSFKPEFNLESKAKLTSFENPVEHLIAQLKPDIIVKNISAKIKENKQLTLYKLSEAKIGLDSSFEEKKIKLNANINLEKVDIPEVKKTFNLKNETTVETNLNFDLAKLNTNVLLDKYPLLKVQLALENKPENFGLVHDLKIELSPGLSQYHDAANELAIIGEPHLSLKGKSQIQHNAPDIQSADFALSEKWLINTAGQLELVQVQPSKLKNGINFSGPVTLDYSMDNKNNYQLDVDLNIAGIQTPPLEKALPLRVISKNNLTWPLSKTQSVIHVDVADQRALNLDLTVNDKKQFLDLVANVSVNTNPEWQVYLKDLKELETIGVLQAKIDLDAKIKHPFVSVLDVDPEKLDEKQLAKMSAKLQLDTTLSQNQSNPGSLLVLAKTATINQQLNWSVDQTQWQSDITVPDLLLPDIAEIKDIHTTVQLNANSGLTPDNADIQWQVDKGKIKLLSTEADVPAMQVGHVVTPLSFVSEASWTANDVDLKKLNLNLGSDLLAVQAAGTASLDGKNAQIASKITSRLRENLFNKPAVSGAGGLEIPIRLTLLEGKQISLEGEMQFDHLNLSIDDLAIQNLNGSFKLEEELLLEKDSAKFRYLLDPNPFQRVDFTRIQPYLNTSSISIDKIILAEKSLGPVLASVMLKQNIFSLQQFDIDLFSGHSAGQFYLDVRPDAWKLGLLSRITHLDPRELLAKDSKLRQSKLSPINTRTAIEFDIHKRLMEGEIVVSQINRDQLLQLLDVIDPAHEDEQMAQLRKGLRFSHPKLVQVDMQRGLMNLKVEIAGLPKAVRVTGLPLTPMIQQFASEALETIDEIPLK